MKSKQDRVCELREYIKKMKDYADWCIEAQDWMRYENACLAISESEAEIKNLIG